MRQLTFILFLVIFSSSMAQSDLQKDVFQTSDGELEIYFVGHGSLMFRHNGTVIHIDPTSREYDYSKMPDADLILVTHQHGDHLDQKAINQIRKDDSMIVLTEACYRDFKPDGAVTIMRNGESKTFGDIMVEAVPAYNIAHKRPDGNPFHPKGEGNGYVLTMGGRRILVAGDTENIPEIKSLKQIDIAFLPMNLPYTMTPEMVADAARAIQPAVLYPYHFGDTDTKKLVALLKDQKNIEVRIRNME